MNGSTHYKTGYGALFTCCIFAFCLWFLAHLVLVYIQRSDELRMHVKTLQPGDVHGYNEDLTFYAGNVNRDVTDDDEESFCENQISSGPHLE